MICFLLLACRWRSQLFQIRDEILSILRITKTAIGHRGSFDDFSRLSNELVEGFFVPSGTGRTEGDHPFGIGKAIDPCRLAAEDPDKAWADTVNIGAAGMT